MDDNGPTPPSEAWKQATGSPVYRLSELMFGSLLASYVLGFLGFSATHAETLLKTFTVEELLETLPYLFISISYAYLTAGLYLSYNAGILTMHHMPLENLRFDFLLALSQAIAYGLSMLFPLALPIALGFSIIFAAFRLHHEHDQMVASFYDVCSQRTSRGQRGEHARGKESLREFQTRFDKLLKEDKYSALSAWGDIQRSVILGSVALIIVGIGVWALTEWKSVSLGPVLISESLLIMLILSYRCHGILQDRAMFLYRTERSSGSAQSDPSMTKMDKEFRDLLLELRDNAKNTQ